MRILSAAEQERFELPPSFDSHHRKRFFSFQKSLLTTAQTFRKPAHQIGFLLNCGYFNASKQFFAPREYQQRDINYVAHQLGVHPDSFFAGSYADRTRQQHEHIILEFYGFKRLDKEAKDLIIREISTIQWSRGRI